MTILVVYEAKTRAVERWADRTLTHEATLNPETDERFGVSWFRKPPDAFRVGFESMAIPFKGGDDAA